jgi:hypothetical protein
MDEVGIGTGSVRLVLSDATSGVGQHEPWVTYTATLLTPSLHASARIEEYGWEPRGFDGYLTDLADKWRGWEGEIVWGAPEGGLKCVAARQSGRNELTVVVSEGTPALWMASATISIEPGEEMTSVAQDVHSLLEPARRR